MGVGSSAGRPATGAIIAPAKPDAAAAAQVHPADEDTIVIYYGGRFRDRNLAPLDPASVQGNGRVILALDPTLAMSEALAVRGRINVENLVVSVLDDRWLTRLRGISDGYGKNK